MKSKWLWILWGGLYALCAGLGFLGPVEGFGGILLTVLSLVFFLPGAVLAYRGHKQKDRKLLGKVRLASAVSLGATLALLIANFGAALLPKTVGNILHGILVLVSSPMVCSQFWALSLFLWACLLVGSFPKKA